MDAGSFSTRPNSLDLVWPSSIFPTISGTSSWTKVLSRGSAVPAVQSADHEMLEKLQKSLPVAILHEATGAMAAGESARAWNKIGVGLGAS